MLNTPAQQNSLHRYTTKALSSDYGRSFLSLILLGFLLASSELVPWLRFIATFSFLTFLWFFVMTVIRHSTKIHLNTKGIYCKNLFKKTQIDWDKIKSLKVRSYGNARARKKGKLWTVITVKSLNKKEKGLRTSRKIVFDSAITDFPSLAETLFLKAQDPSSNIESLDARTLRELGQYAPFLKEEKDLPSTATKG